MQYSSLEEVYSRARSQPSLPNLIIEAAFCQESSSLKCCTISRRVCFSREFFSTDVTDHVRCTCTAEFFDAYDNKLAVACTVQHGIDQTTLALNQGLKSYPSVFLDL